MNSYDDPICMQISGLSIAVVFFALMQQAYAWELDQPVPSLLSAVESNLKRPRTFFLFAILPILLAVLFSHLYPESTPPAISFSIVSILSYILANGAVVVLMSLSHLHFYLVCTAHVFLKKRLVLFVSVLVSQLWGLDLILCSLFL